jgi:hypothetical protein
LINEKRKLNVLLKKVPEMPYLDYSQVIMLLQENHLLFRFCFFGKKKQFIIFEEYNINDNTILIGVKIIITKEERIH